MNPFLPGTGRRTMQSMVEGARSLRGAWRRTPSTAGPALPFPLQGRN